MNAFKKKIRVAPVVQKRKRGGGDLTLVVWIFVEKLETEKNLKKLLKEI